MKHFFLSPKRGFTMFFAVLVSSLALAIGLSIYDLVVRELQLSSTTTQSQYAIYAADSGVECALYWDYKYNGNNSIFPTSTDDTAAKAATGAVCSGEDITATRKLTTTATGSVSTTTLQLPSAFAEVVVEKTVSGGIVYTAIYSHGFNTSATTSPDAVERELEVNY